MLAIRLPARAISRRQAVPADARTWILWLVAFGLAFQVVYTPWHLHAEDHDHRPPLALLQFAIPAEDHGPEEDHPPHDSHSAHDHLLVSVSHRATPYLTFNSVVIPALGCQISAELTSTPHILELPPAPHKPRAPPQLNPHPSRAPPTT